MTTGRINQVSILFPVGASHNLPELTPRVAFAPATGDKKSMRYITKLNQHSVSLSSSAHIDTVS